MMTAEVGGYVAVQIINGLVLLFAFCKPRMNEWMNERTNEACPSLPGCT